MKTNEDDGINYMVVVNEEEQYSIWPAARSAPAGWTAVGEPAPKEKCLQYIEQHWTDMRPRSLREQMQRSAS